MTGINIYTDGAASGNPGPGGYGVIMKSGKHYREISEGFRLTTNNRMELLAVIVGLEAIKTSDAVITIYSDSKYVVDAVEKKWVFGWEQKQFARKKNRDLWIRFLNVYRKYTIKFKWIKGHNNHPENEKCDQLAVSASRQSALKADTWYEQNREQESLF